MALQRRDTGRGPQIHRTAAAVGVRELTTESGTTPSDDATSADPSHQEPAPEPAAEPVPASDSSPKHQPENSQTEDPVEIRISPAEDSTSPVTSFDSEKTLGLLEEEDVFDPSSRRPQLDDFIKFGEFVKWPQFREAFDNLGSNVRFRHVPSAFDALRNLLPRPPDSFLDDLSRTAIRLMKEARSNQLARLFYSCGKLRYINREFMEIMAQKILSDKLTVEMDGCDLSVMIYSIAVLSRFQLLVFAAAKGMRVVDLYQLYAKETPPILFPSQPELVAAICKEVAVSNRLAGFKEQELSNVVYACGLLRAPEPQALQALAKEIADSHRLLKFTGAEFSNTIYGFGLCKYKDAAMLYRISDHLVRTGRTVELETNHLANMLYGFSRMDFAYPPILAAMVKEITTPERLKRFKEQELANIVSCAALIGIQDDDFYRVLGNEIVKSDRLGKYVEHNFSTIVLGLATVGVRDVTVLQKLAAEMRRPERLPSYTSKDICDILWGFNNLEFLDNGFMLSLVAELRKPQRIRSSDSKVWQSCRAHVFSWSLAFPF